MKKIVISSLILANFLMAKEILLTQNQVKEILSKSPTTQKLLKNKQIKIKGGVKKDNFYIFRIDTPNGKGYVYETQDTKFLIIGKVLNVKNGEPLTSNVLPLINTKIVKEAVDFSAGNPKGENVYIVTDPEGPFCRRLERKQGKMLRKNYHIHYILFPLSFHHDSKLMCYYILAGKTDKEKFKRFEEVVQGSDSWSKFKPSKYQIKEFNNILKTSLRAVKELKARGVPSIYNSQFQPIS